MKSVSSFLNITLSATMIAIVLLSSAAEARTVRGSSMSTGASLVQKISTTVHHESQHRHLGKKGRKKNTSSEEEEEQEEDQQEVLVSGRTRTRFNVPCSEEEEQAKRFFSEFNFDVFRDGCDEAGPQAVIAFDELGVSPCSNHVRALGEAFCQGDLNRPTSSGVRGSCICDF